MATAHFKGQVLDLSDTQMLIVESDEPDQPQRILNICPTQREGIKTILSQKRTVFFQAKIEPETYAFRLVSWQG